MSTPVSSSSTSASWWPLPPTRLTVAGAGLLLLLVVISLSFTAWLHNDVSLPWLEGATGHTDFGHKENPLSPSGQVFEAVIFAPLVEESAFRLAFTTSLPVLAAAASSRGHSGPHVALRTEIAGVLLFLLAFASLSFGAMHFPDGLTTASASYLISLIATAPIFVRARTGKPVPPLVWYLAAITTTVAFAAAHVTNFKTLPDHPAVLLLTLPQLVSGGIYCYAAWRYGLRASILAHMTSNALLHVPLFATWLHFVVGVAP